MENFKIVKQGAKYSLVENALKERAFVPNENIVANQKDVAELPHYRWGSWANKSTVISLDGKVKEIDGTCPVETVRFVISDNTLKFEGTKYPIALSVESLELTGLSPVTTFRCNDNTSKKKDWKLPTSGFFQELRQKLNAEDNNALGLVYTCDSYIAFTKNAAELIQPLYDEEIDRLNERNQQWLDSLDYKVGDTVLGVKITDIGRNPNSSASYYTEDGGEIHENSIEDFMDMELPEYVQKVSFNRYGCISYFYNNTWNEDLDDFTDDF